MLQALGLVIALAVGVIFAYVPVFHYVLGTAPIAFIDWVTTLPFSFFIVFQDEIRKYLIRKNPKGLIAKYTYW